MWGAGMTSRCCCSVWSDDGLRSYTIGSLSYLRAINGCCDTHKCPHFHHAWLIIVIRGATIGITRLITGRTQVGGLKNLTDYQGIAGLFVGKIPIGDAQFPIVIIWWIALAAVATYILLMTRPGNWIYGMGGDEKAARNVGVPVDRMKIYLFMATAAAEDGRND